MTDLSRTLGDSVVTLKDIEKYDTFMVKGSKLVPIAKWLVSSETMRMHGKIVDSPIELKGSEEESKEFRCTTGSVDLSDELEDDRQDKIIVFNIKFSEEIWKHSMDNFTLMGLYDLLLAFQIFDVPLTAAMQRKIAFNYLSEAKERGQQDWDKINSFDISVFEDCAFLCSTGVLDMISKGSCLSKLDSYFTGRKEVNKDIDPERIRKFLTNMKNFPKFESIIDAATFAKMLEICFDMEYWYLFSELYCTVICIPGSCYIFDLGVAKVYSRWMNKYRIQGEDRYIKTLEIKEDKKMAEEGYFALPPSAKGRAINPKFEQFKLNDRTHETFQHMAVKYCYIEEVLNMYSPLKKGMMPKESETCPRIELDPVYNFLCPCYMVPIRKHSSCSVDACDDNRCHCRSKILPLDEIKKRLNSFVGGYLQDLDLSKSAITGSAMTVCPFMIGHENVLGFEKYIDTLYGKTLTKLMSGDFRTLILNPSSDSKARISHEANDSSKFSISRNEHTASFVEIPGTDVDILVNVADTKEFSQIAKKHINVIQSKYPQVQVKEITTHSGALKYKVQFPKHEQRDVEIYQASVGNIASYHMGCVRAYYSSMHGKECVSCFPSYLMTIITRLTPDVRFVPGSKPVKQITGKYAIRGFMPQGELPREFSIHSKCSLIIMDIAIIEIL